MASDLSSGCTEAIEVLDEKEEGEISLEDVSSSEEGHLNYGYGNRLPQCSNCLSTQHNATWCTAPAKFYHSKGPNRRVDLILQDAVQGKENRHQIKESGCIGTKHIVSTLQEKNDDLVPISSDSDMEIVGLADNSKQIVLRSTSKTRVKKKRKKKRNHAPAMTIDDLVSSSTVDISVSECVGTLKHDTTKVNSLRSHHREMSPVHRTRSRTDPRSPSRRHRSLVRTHSPFKRSKSPVVRTRSPTIKRSPKRPKSPKRSPYRAVGKTVPRKTSHLESMSSSHNYVDTHKLLKKVRHLDSIGTHSLEETLNKNKEHASSLKEKLTNMMKGVCDNNSDVTSLPKEKTNMHANKTELNDADDDEDLALLRQKALETKQRKSNKQNEQPKVEAAKKVNANIDDDQDEEDLELRMIALRSAVLKKHQNRIQKGMKSGKYRKSNISRSESPFTQSFLDSIPIPGEELLNFASPPHTPLTMNESNHTEDMDLDTDIEREKEKLPYSPTDKITVNIPMDTELLGIQPSDVSFISVNEANSSPDFHVSATPNQDDQKSYQGKIIENKSYLPNVTYYTLSQNALYTTTTVNPQYSPIDPTETVRTDFMKVHNSEVNALKNSNTSAFVDNNTNQEIPYSPTDTPIYDPDLSHELPQTPGPIATSNSSIVCTGSSYSSNMHENNEQYNYMLASQQIQSTGQINNANEDEHLDKLETLSMDAVVGSATSSLRESLSTGSTTTIDSPSEIDADTSPLTESLKSEKHMEYIPNDVKEVVPEPLYMKGVPDVTKDTNKIPTLINRTLVPASILKTNKQLQQPLPIKKSIIQEPTFKSAEMQPVIINEETSSRTNTSFKPIKLMLFPQKSHSILTIPTAFPDPLYGDSTNKTPTNKDNLLIEGNNNVTQIQKDETINTENKTCDTVSLTQKKKSTRKGTKRKNIGTTKLGTKEHDVTGTNSDNMNILDKQINKTSETEDLETCKNSKMQLNAKDNVKISNSETSNNILDEKNQISCETNVDETRTKDTSSSDTVEQVKNMDTRRQSLDEDEEALRAILLASLPKRTKSTNQKQSNLTAVTTALSNCNNQVFANQTISEVALSMVNTINTPDTNGTCSSSHANSCTPESNKNQTNSGEKVINTSTQGSLTAETVTLGSVTSGRKRLIPMTKGPQKKLVKRIPISASTKVVNNAKKYQNAMVQKKLNLQKAALYSKQKLTENKILTEVKSNDNKWSASTKKSLPDTQRIVINLESDTESDSESERHTNKIVSSVNSLAVDKPQPLINDTVEFEKNLDQFLRAVRKKQESLAAARPTSISQTPKKDAILTTKSDNSSNLHTPLAVRHLPASQQEEYRRLKQQIMEREKLKLHRTVENNGTTKNKSTEISTKSILLNNPNKELHSKINQAISVKSLDVNTQQLNKENCSKNLDTIKSTHANGQLCTNNVHSVDKQGNVSPNQAKTISRLMTNLNICISNENNLNKVENKIAGNPLQSVTTPRKVFEPSANEIPVKSKTSPSLKVLSTDEVNQKYVQIQVKNDTNERVVTIHDKVTLNNKTVINQSKNISENKDKCNQDEHKPPVDQEIITNYTQCSGDTVDSDASTLILTRDNDGTQSIRSLDTSESTIRLSQCGDDSRASTILIPESKDESYISLFKNNLLSNDKRSIEESWGAIKRDVKTELSTLINLSRVEQEQHLLDTEEKLVLKRYTIIDELAEMSGNLRQWHMERDLQTNLVAEVKKLREQLKVAEERLQMQRNHINNIGPKVVAGHGKINAGRQECFKLATICSSLGSRIIGKEYKVPEAGAQLLNNRLKEVANHTRQLSRKKVPSIDIPEVHELTKLSDETASIVHSEISQIDDLSLEKDNVDYIGIKISNENEIESNLSLETTTINLEETSEEETVTLYNSYVSNNAESNIEHEVSIEQGISNEQEVPAEQEVSTVPEISTEQEVSTVPEISTVQELSTVPEISTVQEVPAEREVSTEQTDSNSTSVITSDIPSSKNTQESGHKESSENEMVRPSSSTSESCNQKENSTKPEVGHQIKKTLLPYESILTHFKVPRNTNPNGVLCPYELMGTCNDGDCQFIHQRDSRAK
ncbi:uncharacterized protein LOC122397786 isoform X2 [Colletes gigas]|uniref:uncharacterized protein LOC122397786 isoform X2 n=1 Tax=Colletes gigas TaxID=935657 RepID=UPI001C9A549C|nr:uncharacterized protein LOC122397786 isoform X2 [Colletes gigas]